MKTNAHKFINCSFTVLIGFLAAVFLGETAVAGPNMRGSYYDGTADSDVSFPYRPEYNEAIAITIEAWIYRESAFRNDTILSMDFTESMYFGVIGDKLRFYRSGGLFADSTASVPARKWTHVAVAYDGATARFYINGEAAGSPGLNHAGGGVGKPLSLGVDTFNSPNFRLLGYLDEVRLWAGSRSEAQITDAMFQQFHSEPDLLACWPGGGVWEIVSGTYGAFTIGEGPELTPFGILPRDLNVPGSSIPVMMDGLFNEYHGAEMMVIRYPDAAVPDAVAHLVHYNDNLYTFVKGLRDPTETGAPLTSTTLDLLFDRDHDGGGTPQGSDLRWSSSLDPGRKPVPTLLQKGNGTTFEPVNALEALAYGPHVETAYNYCEGEFEPTCLEIRLGGEILHDMDGPIGFAIVNEDADVSDNDYPSPSDAQEREPETWATMTFAESTAKEISILARVREGDTDGDELGGFDLTIYNPLTNLPVYQTTSTAGSYTSIRIPYPEGMPIGIKVTDDGSTLGFENDAFVGLPDPVDKAPTFVEWDELPTLPPPTPVTFFVEVPPPPITFTNFTPKSSSRYWRVRDGEDEKVIPANHHTITVTGTNFHEDVDLFLSQCDDPRLIGCGGEGVLFHQLDIIEISPDGTYITAQLPDGGLSDGAWEVVLHDNWSRDGVDRLSEDSWHRLSPDGDFFYIAPPYPLRHGFEFINRGDSGTPWKLFTAIFGRKMYRATNFCAPDPMYTAITWPIFQAVDAGGRGNCVGFSSTSRLLALEDLEADDFGAEYTFGIPGDLRLTGRGVLLDAFITNVENVNWAAPGDPEDLRYYVTVLVTSEDTTNDDFSINVLHEDRSSGALTPVTTGVPATGKYFIPVKLGPLEEEIYRFAFVDTPTSATASFHLDFAAEDLSPPGREDEPEQDRPYRIYPDFSTGWDWRGPCKGHRPTTLWAHIRRNQAVQFCHESMDNFLRQLQDRQIKNAGNPVQVYTRVEHDPTAYMITVFDGGNSGHAVLPFGTLEGVKFNRVTKELEENPDYRVIEVYDNNFPAMTRYININYVANEYEFPEGPYPGVDVYDGKGIFTLPISIWQNERTRPRILIDGVKYLMKFICGSADGLHEDGNGDRWGWDQDGNLYENYEEGQGIPFMYGLGEEERNAMFTCPPDRAPQTSTINVRGEHYLASADQGDAAFQIEVMDGQAGTQDAFNSLVRNESLSGVIYEPGSDIDQMYARVGMEFNEDSSVAFSYEGLRLPSGNGISLEANRTNRTTTIDNLGDAELSFMVRIMGSDLPSGNDGEQLVGPFTLPPAGAQKIELHNWPEFNTIMVSSDEDGDGVYEQTAITNTEIEPPMVCYEFHKGNHYYRWESLRDIWQPWYSPDLQQWYQMFESDNYEITRSGNRGAVRIKSFEQYPHDNFFLQLRAIPGAMDNPLGPFPDDE